MRGDWFTPETIPALPPGTMQLWQVRADALQALSQRHAGVLAEAEIGRASRFLVEPARQEFVAARVLLRSLLGRARGCNPRNVSLTVGAGGKPSLSEPIGIEFNLAHSHGVVLVAISSIGPVGVDVESIDRRFSHSDEMLEIARATLTPDEIEQIVKAVSPSRRAFEFYRAWTRKEAVAKADGRGIAAGLTYRVEQTCSLESAVSVTAATGGASTQYYVQTPAVGVHHLAALATTVSRAPIAFYDAARLVG